MRFRLYPTQDQAEAMARHCADARFVWNLALEQANCWRREWGPTPSDTERMRQLTEARASFAWLREGSVTVQQQALRDFNQAMRYFFGGSHRRPTWRKAVVHEGFRQVAVRPEHVQRLNRSWGRVLVPKVGWVRFRWTRPVPPDVKSYRVTKDASGRWHIAFAHKPEPVKGPGDGSIVGVDRGIANSATLSTGERKSCPASTSTARMQRRMARQKRGSRRRDRTKQRVARMQAHDAAGRKDWTEKLSTELARRFDVVKIEDLNIAGMTRSAKGTVESPGKQVAQKRGLNRGILANAWGLLEQRLGDKIGDRLILVPAAYSSQTCSACGHVDADSRESQAKFVCTACGMVEHADVNAAIVIRGRTGRVWTGRVLAQSGTPMNRQPQLASSG